MICLILSLCDIFFSSTNTGGWLFVLVLVLYAKIDSFKSSVYCLICLKTFLIFSGKELIGINLHLIVPNPCLTAF